jgi:cytochrome c554/c'-like protein
VSAISINPNQTKAHRARWLRHAVVGAALLRGALLCTWGQDNDSALTAPKFLGAPSCSSSSCHGGAGANKDQYLVWSKYDYHHARPYATLETARAEHIAEALKLGDPTRSAACTACHAPLQTVPNNLLSEGLKISDGVSCESCHGPAEHWLRGHTRHDWTHADRVRAGMRDLRNLYVRANTCVACHQTLSSDIRQAGHPELLFELDGQAVSQPKHWRTADDKPGPQIWLVGQAVALREMSWQLSREKASDETLAARCAALVWLLQLAGKTDPHWPAIELNENAPAAERAMEIHRWSDQLAKAIAVISWSDELTRKCLALLAKTDDSFGDPKVPRPIQARRAERLVLALDRLTTGLGAATAPAKLGQSLDRLFDDVQSLPDFDPPQFAKHLQEFHANASGILETR